MNNNPMPPLDWNNAQLVRTMVGALTQQGLDMLGPAESAITEEYKDIPMRDGFASSIKIHKPSQPPASGSPLIVFCFGGGFISGSSDSGTPYARAFVRLFGAVVVNISYRLAPENKFPISWYDAIDSAKGIAEHAKELGSDPTKGFIIGGVSAGGTYAGALSGFVGIEPLMYPSPLGNLTANLTLASITEKFAHPVTGQWLNGQYFKEQQQPHEDLMPFIC